MAAPTDVRVEANSTTSVVLRWTHTDPVGVWRSTDGVSYAQIAVAEDSYTDTGLDAATKYWYKLSDDSGSTFSDVVTVFTQTCGEPPAGDSDIILPRAGDEVLPRDFNDLAMRVETGLTRFSSPDGRTCTACINDGALILDCINYENCDNIEVVVDQDINSISLPNCENTIVDINFLIPPGTIRGIGGWPAGIGFTGDEAFTSPVAGGANGRSINEFVNRALNVNQRSGRSKPGTSTKGTSTGGLSRGTCVPGANGSLNIGSSNANNSLNCSSNKSLTLTACGGRGPYTWSKTGSVNLNRSSGNIITVTPPTNSGSAVVGKAYTKSIFGVGCGHSVGITHSAGQTKTSYNCDDSINTCPDAGVGGPAATVLAFLDSSCSCSVHSGHPVSGAGGLTSVTCSNNFATGAECAASQSVGSVGDVRTAGMIADGCNPCALQEGATVTVTDALGVQVTVVLKA
jgi:hypothetical protein